MADFIGIPAAFGILLLVPQQFHLSIGNRQLLHQFIRHSSHPLSRLNLTIQEGKEQYGKEAPMKKHHTLEDYKAAVASAPSEVMADKYIAQADQEGYDPWALAELIGVRAERWA